MGTSRAIINGIYDQVNLDHFSDVIVAKVDLRNPDGQELNWLLMGTVVLWNYDGSKQYGEARLLYDANIELEKVRIYLNEWDNSGITLFAGLTTTRDETVTLACNTYKGGAFGARIVALSVDYLEFQ
jgi:hypothetical protein